MLPNCPEFPITWLALAKLGAVMVPINNSYQAHDLEYVLNDSDAMALVIDTQFIPTFREVQSKISGVKKVYRVREGYEDFGLRLPDLARGASESFKTYSRSWA